jgi:Dual-action HEIGH metallo-peptidase
LLPQTPDGYYIVDGDILMTELEVKQMVRERRAAVTGGKPWPETARQGELIVMTESGIPTCYRTENERRLTFAIDKDSFAAAPAPNAYAQIADELASAIVAWQDACPECNIKFVRLDLTAPAEGQANFIVKYVGDRGSLIARAFFPKDLPPKRYIEITRAYYTAGYDKVGVLRHELGHVLGYRHEQIRPEAPLQCFFNPEDKAWTRIEGFGYDPKSVMHYPCEIGGSVVVGTYKFELTEVDKTSHRKFYMETCR